MLHVRFAHVPFIACPLVPTGCPVHLPARKALCYAAWCMVYTLSVAPVGDGRKRKAVKPKSCLVPELGINSKLSTTNSRHYNFLINF